MKQATIDKTDTDQVRSRIMELNLALSSDEEVSPEYYLQLWNEREELIEILQQRSCLHEARNEPIK